jgi:pantothenate kinase
VQASEPELDPEEANVTCSLETHNQQQTTTVDCIMNTIDATISPHRVGNPGREFPVLIPSNDKTPPQIALDIGGSLIKMCWFSTTKVPGGRLHFRKWETSELQDCLNAVAEIFQSSVVEKRVLCVTGGGAIKYFDQLREKLPQVTIEQLDEMACLMGGLNFLLHNVQDEVFTYDTRRSTKVAYEEVSGNIYPLIFVNIGSGVSILKVNSETSYERISGSSLGGGTFWGLLSCMTSANNFDEMLKMAESGDNEGVDLTVGDIFGSDYSQIALNKKTIASTMGKVFKKPRDERQFKQEDVAQSILFLLCNNISQLAFMNAKLSGTERVVFGGCFIRGHPLVMSSLEYGLQFWSSNSMKAYFLRHEGYVGAIGAFFAHESQNQRSKRSGSVFENFTLARGSGASIGEVGSLEFQSHLVPFPLIAQPYVVDTMDLTSNTELAEYWIDLLEKNLHNLVGLAVEWEQKFDDRDDLTVSTDQQRAKEFEATYRGHLKRLREDPAAYGQLSVRGLLQLREACLVAVNFYDLYDQVKKEDNEAALATLPLLLKQFEVITDEGQLIDTLVSNVVAMNMFDLGAFGIVEMLKQGDLTFQSARDIMRPSTKLWHMDKLIHKFQTEEDWPKKTIVFVDNSGADVVLGVMPFVRWLLSRNSHSQVILAANTSPSVNDVTAEELKALMERICTIDASFKTDRLQVLEQGATGPCLDFRRVDTKMAKESLDSDFVVLIGMGRSIHSNFHARFIVPSLKLAVFKNQSAAEYLGVNNYDGMCLFEDAVIAQNTT